MLLSSLTEGGSERWAQSRSCSKQPKWAGLKQSSLGFCLHISKTWVNPWYFSRLLTSWSLITAPWGGVGRGGGDTHTPLGNAGRPTHSPMTPLCTCSVKWEMMHNRKGLSHLLSRGRLMSRELPTLPSVRSPTQCPLYPRWKGTVVSLGAQGPQNVYSSL